MAISCIPASTISTLSASHFFSNSTVVCLKAALSSALFFISSSLMSAEGTGGDDNEATTGEELPLDGAMGTGVIVALVAGITDSPNRLPS